MKNKKRKLYQLNMAYFTTNHIYIIIVIKNGKCISEIFVQYFPAEYIYIYISDPLCTDFSKMQTFLEVVCSSFFRGTNQSIYCSGADFWRIICNAVCYRNVHSKRDSTNTMLYEMQGCIARDWKLRQRKSGGRIHSQPYTAFVT